MKKVFASLLIVVLLGMSLGGGIEVKADDKTSSDISEEINEEIEQDNLDNKESQLEEEKDVVSDNEVQEELQGKEADSNGASSDLDNDEPEKDNRANSWRFSNGQLNSNNSIQFRSSARAYHPSATKKGIDVSEWNGTIDWEKVKASGIDYAIIRCGYGMNYSNQDDKYWLRNVSECERLGIPFGVYIYSYATNTDRALSEAQHVLRLINGRNLTYPVYFDMEDDSTIGSDLAAIANTFCTTIQNAGYAVGVYSSTSWWNSYLTNSCFANWHRWVAEWGPTCNYKGQYAMWQYTSDGSVNGIDGRVDMNYLIGYPAQHGTSNSISVPPELRDAVTYSAHVQDIGWMNEMSNGAVAGTVGVNKHVEAIKINAPKMDNVGIEYQVYVHGTGWQDYVTAGEVAGTTGRNQQIEAMRIRLTGENADNYEIFYRVHSQEFGWLDWTKNGNAAGSTGYNYQMEAYQILVLPAGSDAPGNTETPFKEKDDSVNLENRVHVKDLGWLTGVENGQIAGTTGKNLRVEAYSLTTKMDNVGIKYASLVQNKGWQDYVADGQISGTVGEARRIEAIKVELTGENKENYNVFYRVHVSDLGWLGWAENGQEAGTSGYNAQIEAMQIRILKADSSENIQTGEAYRVKSADIEYQAHVRNIGWQQAVRNGETAGTTGRALSIEALAVAVKNQDYSGSLRYQAHVSDIGWQGWRNDGEICGTTGRAKSIESVKIELTGEMAKQYDIYYRVHSRDYGWLGWTKNGEAAGTQGCAKPMEAVQIKLIKKGEEFKEYDNGKNSFIKK